MHALSVDEHDTRHDVDVVPAAGGHHARQRLRRARHAPSGLPLALFGLDHRSRRLRARAGLARNHDRRGDGETE